MCVCVYVRMLKRPRRYCIVFVIIIVSIISCIINIVIVITINLSSRSIVGMRRDGSQKFLEIARGAVAIGRARYMLAGWGCNVIPLVYY